MALFSVVAVVVVAVVEVEVEAEVVVDAVVEVDAVVADVVVVVPVLTVPSRCVLTAAGLLLAGTDPRLPVTGCLRFALTARP